MRHSHFLLVIFLAISAFSFAQTILDYSFFTHSTGSLENMSSGTSLLLPDGVYQDNVASSVNNIGFDFKFGATDFTQFSANSNGQMRLGPTVIYGSAISYAPAAMSILAPLSADNGIRANGKLHYKLLGTAPNRRLVVEWKNVVIPATTSPSNYNFSTFQVWLYETTNRIDFVYGEMYVNSSSNQNRAVFISTGNVSGAVGWVQHITSNPTWINSGTMYSDTQFSGNSTMFNLYGYPDGHRRVFTFNPPDPLAVPNPALLSAPGNSAAGASIYSTLVWSSGGGMPTSYDLYWNGSETPVNLSVTSWDPGILAYSTAYSWQIVPRNANGPALNCPVWTFSTKADQTISSFPHSEGFDGAWSGSPPAPSGWTVVNANSDSYKWHQSSILLPHSQPYIAAGEGNSNDYLISPPIDLSTTTARIKWWDKAFGTSYSYTYKVMVSTTSDLVPAFTQLLGTYTCNSGSWVKHILNLDAFIGQTIYLAFWQTASSSTIAGFGIDDFSVEILPLTPIFSLSPAVSEWDFEELLPGGSQAKTFTVTNLGCGTLELTSVTTTGSFFDLISPPADLSLAEEESTNLYVRYAPLETGTHSGSLNISFNREIVTIDLTGTCVPDPFIYYADLPYQQNFDSLNPSELPLGWIDLGPGYTTQLLSAYSHSDPNCLSTTINYNGTGMIALPELHAGGTDIRLRFQARRLYYGSAGLDVGWLSTAGDASSFVPVSNLSVYSTEYMEFSVIFPSVTDVFVPALRADCDTSVLTLIDDVVIEELTDPAFSHSPASLWFGECQHSIPTAWQNVTVTNVGGGVLNLSVADINLSGEDAAQFEIDPVNLPASLSCNQSVLIPVRLIPSDTGSLNASLNINYNSLDYSVALSGSGLQPGIICIGTGNLDLGLPIDTYYAYTYSQNMYMQSELNQENKQIEKIWFYWTGGLLADTAANWTIYMGHVSWEEFYYDNYWVPWYDLTQVFSGEVFLYEASYWVEITLDTPFPYNNIQNLVIAVDENTPGYELSATSDFRCSPSTLQRGIKFSSDSVNPWYGEPPVGTTILGYPNIRLLFADVPTLYPPQLSQPVDSAINLPQEGFSFSWEADPQSVPVDSYTLYVSESNAPAEFFGTTYVYHNAVSPYNPENIAYQLGETWYWTVVAHAAGYPDAYQWPPNSFTIEALPYVYLPYNETLIQDQFPPDWTQTYDGTIPFNRWSVINSNLAGGQPYEFRADWYWGVSGTARLISPPLWTGDLDLLGVSFKYCFEALGAAITAKLQYSLDLLTWQDSSWMGPGISGNSSGSAEASIQVSNAPVTYLGWTLDGDFLSFNFWWLDDFQFQEIAGVPVVRMDSPGTLNWGAVPGAAGYNIYVSSNPGGTFSFQDSTTALFWTDPAFPEERKFYRVRSFLPARRTGDRAK